MPENPDKYTIETESFTLNNPTCAGYTFLGWTTGKGTGPEITTPNKSVTIEKGSKGNLIFVAHWERADVTVNYEPPKAARLPVLLRRSRSMELPRAPQPRQILVGILLAGVKRTRRIS